MTGPCPGFPAAVASIAADTEPSRRVCDESSAGSTTPPTGEHAWPSKPGSQSKPSDHRSKRRRSRSAGCHVSRIYCKLLRPQRPNAALIQLDPHISQVARHIDSFFRFDQWLLFDTHERRPPRPGPLAAAIRRPLAPVQVIAAHLRPAADGSARQRGPPWTWRRRTPPQGLHATDPSAGEQA
jgi:hypothetical protein